MDQPVNIDDCPTRFGRLCKCAPCVACGFGEHMAIHGGRLDDPLKLYDHAYVPPMLEYGRAKVRTAAK